ncbi:hypothetical protein BLA27_05300 [Brucella cytisi]|uniref:Uncharacterized protein n=1 Tax=Brucella cytisi TaxID=407152 RepID=A0A1J6HP65_9HYPH|nr:hypothetical protein BLA27_05300 [Brucella cytisi]
MMKRMQHPMVNIQNISSVRSLIITQSRANRLSVSVTRETIFRDKYLLAQPRPSHEGVLYRRADRIPTSLSSGQSCGWLKGAGREVRADLR